ncbi:MAG TPA: hypothetical protein V6D12_14230 [Candidatus Obscuribacterales bacterium]
MVNLFRILISRFFSAFLSAFLIYLAGKIGTTSQDIIAMVSDLEKDSTLSGEEKRKRLATQLKMLAITTGKEISKKTINLAIETGVSVFKAGV